MGRSRRSVLTWLGAAAMVLLAGDCVRAEDGDIIALAKVTPEEALTIDALMTTVNGQPIFVKDLIRPLDADFRKLGDPTGPGGARSLRDFKDRAYERLHTQLLAMVGDILLYSVAKEQLGEDEMKRVDVMMNSKEKNLLAKYRGSRALADDELRKKGSSVDKELATERRELMVELYKHKVIYPKINVRRQDVLEEYEKDIKQYTVYPEVDLYQITITVRKFLVTPGENGGPAVPIKEPTAEQIRKAESEAMGLAQQVYTRLQKGEDFATLAAKYSDDPRATIYGGRWQHLRRGTLAREDVEKKAFSMKANTLIEPFLSPDKDPTKAWAVVLKVGEVEVGHIKPFEDVQEELENKLRQKQYSELLDAYYKRLYSQAAIDNKERVEAILETATAVVVAKYAVK